MRILGIETSCDDTGIAILEIKNKRFKTLANIVSSQVKLHAKYGGVYPTLAKREHEKNLPIVLKKAMKYAKVEPLHIDAIALTVGPGLDPCLWIGITFAQTLAKSWNIPIIPVNHIEGHLLISLLSQRNIKKKFPAIALIVSGGHTQLILVRKIGDYKILGETRDDAAGECFDKTARILGLPYPGGPAIAKEAEKTNFENVGGGRGAPQLPRPMIHTKDYDFSFSGLKTAVLYNFQSRPEKVRKSKQYIQTIAKEIQQAIIDVLIAKTLRAAQEYNAKSIVLGGGVAANLTLRTALKKECARLSLAHLIAPKNLCTDNGLMIALAGYFNLKKQTSQIHSIGAQPNLRIE